MVYLLFRALNREVPYAILETHYAIASACHFLTQGESRQRLTLSIVDWLRIEVFDPPHGFHIADLSEIDLSC
jgi:hypothetical protein